MPAKAKRQSIKTRPKAKAEPKATPNAKAAPKAKAAAVKLEPCEDDESRNNSKKGEGLDPKRVSAMLGLMKYQSTKGKDSSRANECKEALAVYHSLAD